MTSIDGMRYEAVPYGNVSFNFNGMMKQKNKKKMIVENEERV